MGRYLDLLKIIENRGATNQQNQQNLSKGGFAGFAGTPPPAFQINSAKSGSNEKSLGAIRAWLASIGEGDRATIDETLDQCRRDPEALAYFTERAAGLQKIERNATSCKTCQHFKRPGLSPGYCGGRDDLPLAYGVNHPLRKLPSDGGTSCDQWQDSS